MEKWLLYIVIIEFLHQGKPMASFWACWRGMAVKMWCQTYLRHTMDGKRKNSAYGTL